MLKIFMLFKTDVRNILNRDAGFGLELFSFLPTKQTYICLYMPAKDTEMLNIYG